MPYCRKCGSVFNEKQAFCGKCGESLNYLKLQQKNDIKNGKPMSILAYLGITFFLPLVVCPDSKFGRFHANQGLLLLITEVIVGVIKEFYSSLINAAFNANNMMYGYNIVNYCGIVNWFIHIIDILIGIAMLALVIIGMVNAANGKESRLPVIGKFNLIK